jgi:hypothetical protein
MSPELILAIKERIAAGQTKEVIKDTVLQMGHQEVVFESAYSQATSSLGEAAPTNIPVPPAALPSAYELLENSLAFIFKRVDIVFLLLVPSLLLFALTYASDHVFEPQLLTAAIDAFLVVGVLVYVVALFTVMYMVIAPSHIPTCSDALQWVRQNLLSLLWVSVLMMFVLVGGFALFIIPGIVLSLTLYFSQYALVIEDQKGMLALSRSRDLVRGRLSVVAVKLIAFTFYVFAPLFLIFIAISLATSMQPFSGMFSLAGGIAVEVASTLVTIIGMHAMSRLYRSLQVGRPLITDTPSSKNVRYWFLAFIGVVAIGGLIAMAVYFESDITETLTPDTTSLRSELHTAAMTAQIYATAHNNSYKGVCEVLRTEVTSADYIECNDSETQWAILGETWEESWCADTKTASKLVQTPLEDRLTCLTLPTKQTIETVSTTTDPKTNE